MSTIVAGFIDNPEGQHALDLAMDEAGRRAAKLIVIHSMKGGSRTTADDVLRYREALEDVEARLAAAGIDHEVIEYVRGNNPAEDLLAAADGFEAELIVIGYRKRSPAGKFLLGSHAHDILMGAEVPVLATIAPE
jgi:nucleotide-binding universal stress UspA family protein